MRTLLLIAVLASPVCAGTFVGTADLQFSIVERLDSGLTLSSASANGIGQLVVTTDYQKMGWEVLFDVDLPMAGGPEESFETRFQGTGRIHSDGMYDLSFPDAAGNTTAGNIDWLLESQFTVVERIVNAEDTHNSRPFAAGGRVPITRLNVAAYPEVQLSFGLDSLRIGEALADPGSHIAGSMYIRGFSDLLELPAGDFNSNGIADAADYPIWRNGEHLAPLLTSYSRWKNNFGVAATGVAVPEPATWALLLVGLVWLRPRCCRRV